ncbi:MAG: BACON domain-containing protein [Alistipes sp.]|nr:BACON domain-containing protein [Alistipes sp.]
MKKFFLLLVATGMIFTACTPGGGLDEDNNGNLTEQPGGGSQGGEDNPGNPDGSGQGGDENGETPSIPKIELSQQYIEVDFESAQYSVSVTSPYSWETTSKNDWIIVDTNSGIAGTKELKFSVERNVELDIREGTIVIKNEDANLFVELYVIQRAFIPSDMVVAPQLLHFPVEGGTQEIAITANFEYAYSANADWLTIKKSERGIKVTVPNYVEVEDRTAEITISNEKYGISKVVKATQGAFVPAITIEPESLAFAVEGGTQEIAITANIEYEVLENSEWLIVESIKNGIKVTVSPSYVMETRNTIITILNNEYNLSDTIDIVQEPVKWSKSGSIIGSWKLTIWCEEESVNQVYMNFHDDNTFDLYQKLYSVVWFHYKGTYSLNDNMLTGVYSDGIAWSAEYNVLYGINQICLIKKSDNSDISIYAKESIPDYIIDEAKDPDSTRSEIKHRYF